MKGTGSGNKADVEASELRGKCMVDEKKAEKAVRVRRTIGTILPHQEKKSTETEDKPGFAESLSPLSGFLILTRPILSTLGFTNETKACKAPGRPGGSW